MRHILALGLAFAASRILFAVEAPLVADAHVNAARPAANSGAISNLAVGGGYTSLMQFDLGTLPAGTQSSQIARVLLRLYCNRADTPGTVSVGPVGADWGEFTVTYNNLPTLATATQTVTVSQAGSFVWVDVTSLVQQWIATPSGNHGIALSSSAAVLQFDSKENDLTAHPPLLDIVLTSQGPKGDTGATGPQGPAGPQGVQGIQGATGLTGATGAVGPAGAAGAQGPKGDAGATGPAGPQGVQGPQGPTGPQGLQGIQGATGASGAQGAKGDTGPQGPPVSFRGAWLTSTTYSIGDAVSSNGNSYIAVAANSGRSPDTNASFWSLLAQAGAKGAVGSTGPQGPMGPAGPMGPQGAQGSAGATGTMGPSGVNFKGEWVSSTGYVAHDAVTYGGSTYVALSTNLAVAPPTSTSMWSLLAKAGDAGATGPAGASASVSVGSVTTGVPGSQAAVTNSGTSSAAVLNFVIPQGATGAAGTGGGGTGGTSGPSIYHSVTFASVYYSVSNPNGAATETDPVLTWVPAACTATQLSVYSRQSSTVTVTLRSGVPGSMADTGLSCSATNGGSCTATGAVGIAANSMVDINIRGASGTAAGVWTSLTCN